MALTLAITLFFPTIGFSQAKKAPPGNPPRGLADLLGPAAKPGVFPPPPRLEDAKLTANGLRKIVGTHLTLVTNLPADKEIEELPTVFDQAVSQWGAYFGIDPAKTQTWQLVGYLLKDKDQTAPFEAAGCIPPGLPPFLNGFQQGAEFWFYDQPAYYRRHLMLHEGTHAFTSHFLGGGGPPWFNEGIAELLGTHDWTDGKLQINIMPAKKENVPYWGRVKIIRDEFAAGRGLQLIDVMKYGPHAHLKNEPYGWSWGAAYFLDRHPLASKVFRELKNHAADRSIDFSRNFYNRLGEDWAAVNQDWQLFVTELDYGYDVPRAASVHTPTGAPLPANGKTVQVAADRGWQSTGVTVAMGENYHLTAKGQFELANVPQPWICEPNGITLKYYQGKPLGILLAAVADPTDASGTTGLLRTQVIGNGAMLKPEKGGTLYLRLNDSPTSLADNQGQITVEIQR